MQTFVVKYGEGQANKTEVMHALIWNPRQLSMKCCA